MNLHTAMMAVAIPVTVLGGLALFGGDCFNLALTKKSRRFFGHLYARCGVSLNAS